MKSAEFVITRLDTRALQAMREVEIHYDDYVLEQPTNVLPRSPRLQVLVRASREVRAASERVEARPRLPAKPRVSWPAMVSITASVLTFVVLACVAALGG